MSPNDIYTKSIETITNYIIDLQKDKGDNFQDISRYGQGREN